MIRFPAGLELTGFTLELANVLHHAAVWGGISRTAVQVLTIDTRDAAPAGDTRGALRVELATEGDRASGRAALVRYLRGALAPSFAISDAGARVVVEWFPGS